MKESLTAAERLEYEGFVEGIGLVNILKAKGNAGCFLPSLQMANGLR